MTRDALAHRYGKLSITLHWLMLALFVGVYACIEIKGLLPKGHALKSLFLGLHGLFGLSIFCVGVGALARAAHPASADYADVARLADRRFAPDAPGVVWADDRHAFIGLADAVGGWQADALFRIFPAFAGGGRS